MKKITTLLIVCLIATTAHAQLSSGLVAWWTFNGTAKDGTSKGHNGTATSITYAAGKTGIPNTAAVFNGTSSIIKVPYQSDLNTDTFSVCTVIKLNGYYTGTCQGNYIFAKGVQGSNGSYGLQAFDNAYNSCSVLDTSKEVFAAMAPNLPPDITQQYAPNIVTNQWYCVVTTFDGATSKTYIDGILKSTYTVPGALIGSDTVGLSIGAYGSGLTTGYPYWLNGAMDDLRLYNKVLKATDIDSYCTNYHKMYPESVENINSLRFLNVYPNPNNGSFTISGYVGNTKNVLVEISNTLGQIVYREDVTTVNNELNKTISLSAANGVYYINLRTADNHKSMKVLINR